jgi:hypothetical protein
MKHIEEALKKGAKLHIFRSGGGLRVATVTKDHQSIGYGESIDVMLALQHIDDELNTGKMLSYEEKYSGKHALYPHYLTGSTGSSCALDRWILKGRGFDAEFIDGQFQVDLRSQDSENVPKEVTNYILKSEPPNRFRSVSFSNVHRKITYNSYTGLDNGDVSCITAVRENPLNKSPWNQTVKQVGRSKSGIIRAFNSALKSQIVEID